MTDIDWWPDGYKHPAFEVRRRRYGSEILGGDYVRGSAGSSTGGALPYTALRFPTRALEPSAFDISARGLLFAQAHDYDTIKLIFHLPTSVYDTFREMSIVRSSYGKPVEPLQGVTIFRRKREDFATVEGKLIPPVIYDEFVAPKVPDKTRPGQYVDGITPNGRWYYYTAFFCTTPTLDDWAPMMSDQCLLPRDYHHAEHLWDAIPPYYQWVDSNYNAKNFLQRFLSIFGFELDRTREYVESLLELHNVDESPMMLLKHLGANYGLTYQEGLGDIRYRALMANLSHMLSTRGTAKGLLELVETASKYDCDVTQGTNTMLTTNDSNFISGLGHWAPIHPSIPFTIPATTWLPYTSVTLAKANPNDPVPPTGAPGSEGVMLVDSPNNVSLGNIFITTGAGKLDATAEYVPYYSGIPVNPSQSLGMTVWIKAAADVQVFAYMIPFTSKGQIIDVCSISGVYQLIAGNAAVRPNAAGTQPTDWFKAEAFGTVPDDCEYVVPAILFKNRQGGAATGRSPKIHVAAVMVYRIDVQGSAAITPSNRYLTLGNPAELIGATRTAPAYEGYVIGSPG